MKKLHFLKPLLKKIDKYLLGIADFDEVDYKKTHSQADTKNEKIYSKPIH